MPRLGVDPAAEDVAKMRCNDVTFGAVQSDSVEHFGNFSPNETYITGSHSRGSLAREFAVISQLVNKKRDVPETSLLLLVEVFYSNLNEAPMITNSGCFLRFRCPFFWRTSVTANGDKTLQRIKPEWCAKRCCQSC